MQLVVLPENGNPGLLRRAVPHAAVTTATNEPQPAPRRVRPHQAAPLAPSAAGAFGSHAEGKRLLPATMCLAFLFGGGRQHDGATLTLWRVWPRWSTPLVLVASVAGMLAITQAGLPLAFAVAGQIAVGVLSVAGFLRALTCWTGLPAGSVMVGDVANSGAKGAGRALVAAVCAEADRRDWNLALLVRSNRPKVVTLYSDLMFIPIGAQHSQLIMGRRRQP